MTLSVVIVNYNVKHYLRQCLDSVQRAAVGLDVDVWVVDNASSDGSVAELRSEFKNVHWIENHENVGFAKANNQAIRQSEGELVLLLNPDTFIAEDVLNDCIRFFEKHPNAGALGIHMVNRDGSFARESRRGLPTPATAFYKVIGLNRLFPTSRRFAHYHMGHLPEFADARIEALSGAFMMLRRKTLEQTGLLDESYFMYGEDIDLSYRIGQSGWECWYSPKLMLHYKGESTQQTSFRYVYNFYHAMLIFFRKHFARRYWFAWIIVELAVFTMGFLSMCSKWLIRARRGLSYAICRNHSDKNRPSTPESLLFIGGDEAWEAVQEICLRCGLIASRVNDLTKPQKCQYFVFEITAEGRPYLNTLWQMVDASRRGLHGQLGTFNLKTRTLILPNDIYC